MEHASELDSLIIEKIERLKSFLRTIVPESDQAALQFEPLDLQKLDLFKLFLFFGGTSDSLNDLVIKKFNLVLLSNEDRSKLKEFTACIFELLTAKLCV